MENEEFPVIHNGVDFDAIERNSNDENVRMVLENLEIEKEDKIVGSVFRIVEEKNPELWIDVAGEVITKMENTHFVIVGGGPTRSNEEKKWKECKHFRKSASCGPINRCCIMVETNGFVLPHIESRGFAKCSN